jgi:hypothetical protein
MSDKERFVVEVRENVTEALIEHEGHVYVSPPQGREQALELVALLLGDARSVKGATEQLWRQAIAGGQRSVRLRPVEEDHVVKACESSRGNPSPRSARGDPSARAYGAPVPVEPG